MTDKPKPLEIIHADEPILEFRLSNGYTVRARLILTQAWEMSDQDAFGNPNIQVIFQAVPMGVVPTKAVTN
jgi:hypothetical protein